MSTKNKRRSERHASSNGDEAMSRDLTQYVTTKQAAEIMGVGQDHIRKLLGRGKVNGLRLGRDWIVFKPSIDKYLEGKSARGRPPLGAPQPQTAS